MKRMPFERPTEHYDERISSIDEQICALLKQRKNVSNNNPGFPPTEYISSWAGKYNLYEDLLNSIFSTLRMEEDFKSHVEPKNFIKHLPILKAVEKEGRIFTITFIRQYENASVVHLNIDWDETNHLFEDQQHRFYKLDLGEEYDCRMNSGSGTTGQYTYDFIVSPPIPDDQSGLNIVFKEYQDFFKDKPTGLEIVFQVD